MNNLDPKSFYFELPLYTQIEITNENLNELVKLLKFSGNIDEYNPELKENTTYFVSALVDIKEKHRLETKFIMNSAPKNYIEDYIKSGGESSSVLICKRNGYRILIY